MKHDTPSIFPNTMGFGRRRSSKASAGVICMSEQSMPEFAEDVNREQGNI